jgi:hypothetical protein
MKISKRKINNSPVYKSTTPGLLAASILCVTATTMNMDKVNAGVFIDAGDGHEDRITHPSGYTGAGGSLDINVCILPTTTSVDNANMEQPVKNAIAYWNKLQPTTSNLRQHLPGGNKHAGFESIFVHELGHCIGIAHPNLAGESGLSGNDRNYTKSTVGKNGFFDTNAGSDTVIGSADDSRDDDINLHWFRADNNNPFSIASKVDMSTYALSTNQLPGGSLFAANGDKDVSKLYSAPYSEAIMQQGALFGEIQRTLSHDDVATLRLAMSGIDETADSADDYTLNLIYAGIGTGDCDISVSFSDSYNGLAVCRTKGSSINGDTKHSRITSAEIVLNPDYNWHFNTDPQCSQSTELVAGQWRMISMPCQLGISTPNSVEAVFGDNLAITDYDTRWVLYEYQPESGYRQLELTDPLNEGQGYWMISLDDKTIDVLGEYPSNVDYPLGDGTPYGKTGKWNLAGTPFRFDTAWADVQVINTDGSVVALSQASELINSTAWRWNGETEDYDTLTPDSGTLSPFDGIWVYSTKAGTALRVPMSNAERTTGN